MGLSDSFVGYTVKEPVELIGDPYFLGQPAKIIVHPNPRGDGVFFKNRGARGAIPLNLDTIQPKKFLSARYNVLKDERFPERGWLVIEHITSAVIAALGMGARASAIIEVPTELNHAFVPVVGAGIRQQFEPIYAAREPLETKGRGHTVALHMPWKGTLHRQGYTIVADGNSLTYMVQDPKVGTRSITLSPSATPMVTVRKGIQPDVPALKGLTPQAFSAPLSTAYLQQHPEIMEARPIGRLQNPIIYRLMQVLAPLVKFRGICDANYLMVRPGEETPDVRAHMYDIFRGDENERLVHTYLDFIAEVHLLSLQMRCADLGFSVELGNTTHLFRMKALKDLYREGVFSAE